MKVSYAEAAAAAHVDDMSVDLYRRKAYITMALLKVTQPITLSSSFCGGFSSVDGYFSFPPRGVVSAPALVLLLSDEG